MTALRLHLHLQRLLQLHLQYLQSLQKEISIFFVTIVVIFLNFNL